MDRDSLLVAGAQTAFVDASSPSDERYRPSLITNSQEDGCSLLSVLKREFSSCSSFDLCVAFIADTGLQPLVQVLSSLCRRGVKGRILTSTYLNFNRPEVFEKLLEYDNIDVRVYQGSMHAKGYMFKQGEVSTVIIGSSNLTQTALTCNREWNVLFRSYESGDMLSSARSEFDELWSSVDTVRLSAEWIEEYRDYRKRHQVKVASNKKTFVSNRVESLGIDDVIRPNKMQSMALQALKTLHDRKEPRALLVSATGTGKTYLSAFDVAREKPGRVLFLAHRRRILDASKSSYERLLGNAYSYAMYETGMDCAGCTCVFAMCSTISKHLDQFDPGEFDYIIIDEAHRTGSASYRAIMGHFTPKFYLGMTATPNRTDGYDVFALFNHVIAYQITLQDALANEMLVPFHYFGIADLTIDYQDEDDFSLFTKLTSADRVKHVTKKIEEYTVDKDHRRGLIFCNRNDEAQSLSEQFNALGYRTLALSGANTDAERDAAIANLEAGEIEYIFSVDIFNEGIDIPSVNQIIMLRRTESAIVFVQQLGRGLRKNAEKEYTLVLDFIGNYQNNFFIPVALSGDKTYNKDHLRTIVKEGSSVIPGASTVSFDRISEARVYRAIDGGDFTAARFLKSEYSDLRQMLGRVPSLEDFDRNGSIDPLLIFKKFGSYHAFLSKYESSYGVEFSSIKCNALKFISQKLANGKRFEDLFMLYELVGRGQAPVSTLMDVTESHFEKRPQRKTLASACAVLYGDFASAKDFVALAMMEGDECRLATDFANVLKDDEFKRQVLEVLKFGLARHYASYGDSYKGTSFVLNAKYTYEEVCRLLDWDKNVNGQNIGGYKYDAKTNTYPVFINYDKEPGISDSIRYEDRFVTDSELIAISKQPRDLNSPEIQRLMAWPGNGMKTYLFMRKNKKDEGGKEFYFFGEMYPTGNFKEIVMPVVNKKAVEITYRLDHPIRHDLYEFMTSDLSEDESKEGEPSK